MWRLMNYRLRYKSGLESRIVNLRRSVRGVWRRLRLVRALGKFLVSQNDTRRRK